LCDLAYSVQVEQIERRSLAEMQLAPHMESKGQISTPEVAVAEFDAWLNEMPPDPALRTEAGELENLITGK
jgi:hypothetical protein